MNKISACVFIKDTFIGAFTIFESMASLLPFVDEFLVMDLGSDDGTFETLEAIASKNKKVKLEQGEFYNIDANVFATLANDLIAICKYDNVLYYQADEIWHQNLLRLMAKKFEDNIFDLSFWRIQYRENFQIVKWFPQVVHRVGHKNNFNFDGDGMNSDRYMEPPICSDYGGSYFQEWGNMGQEGVKPYVDQMITDVSLVGGFLENIPERRGLHAPFWHEEPTIEGELGTKWMLRERDNPNWLKTESPYNLPYILRWHVGRTKYNLRPELLQRLKDDTSIKMLGLNNWR